MDEPEVYISYALKVQGSEARSGYNDAIVTHEGEWFWVIDEPEGWVEATSTSLNGIRVNEKGFPPDLKTFRTVKAAEKFAKRWEGHPWWCKPNGTFEVVKVKPRVVKRIEGWESADGT